MLGTLHVDWKGFLLAGFFRKAGKTAMDTWLEMGGWRHYNDQIYTQPPCDSHTIWAKFSVRKNSQGFSQKYLQSQPFSNFSVLMILLFFSVGV